MKTNGMSGGLGGVTRRVAALGAAGLLAAGGVAVWGTTEASAATRTCSTGDLYVSVSGKDAAAGSAYWTLRYTNTSTSSCTLRGYPGVSVLNSAHHQIGSAAKHSGRSYSTVTVKAGHSAVSVIRTANGPVGGPCLATGSLLRVYPPASTKSVLIPASVQLCSGVFDEGPVGTTAAL
jgi:hypothetical protein